MLPQFTLTADSGRRFLIRYAVPSSVKPRGTVLVVQPFAEEFFLCRRVLAEQARRLSARGWHVILPDLFACGDSDGDESSLTLAHWRDELDGLLALLHASSSGATAILASRLGCLLAVDAVARLREPVDGLILWQPPDSGKQILDPLLRTPGFANAAIQTQAQTQAQTRAATVEDVRSLLVSVAGVSYPRSFIDDLAGLSLASCPGAVVSSVQWIHSARTEMALERGSGRLQQLATGWRDAGCQVIVDSVIADPYWGSMEPTSPTQVYESTERFLDAVASGRRDGP